MPEVYDLYPHKSVLARQNKRNIPLFMYALIILTLCGFAALLVVGCLLLNLLINSTPQPKELPILPAGSYPVIGEPTINASFINRVLDRYSSPAEGKGQTLYDYGIKYQIDPAYALAFFMHESSFGTKGVAKVTKSLGNIRATEGYQSYQGYRKYKTWEDGFEDWYKLIAQLYVGKWRLYTVDQIIPVYAPKEDNNDEEAYIRIVKIAVSKWRKGIVAV